MTDFWDTLRLEASAYHDTSSRIVRNIVCPACSQRVYPRHPTVPNERYLWSHGPHTAQNCMLESKQVLSPDKINAIIFGGRQEGESHRGLVESVRKLVEQDPKTEINSIDIGKYEPPSEEMRGEFPYGRFPDVKFIYGQTRVVLEAQLATITLHGINGRRAFYDRKGACLLWIMRHFDPQSSPRAWLKDITADQQGVLFSLDAEVESLSGADGPFRLRAFFL